MIGFMSSNPRLNLQQIITIAVISSMLLMDNIDANILNIAIPTMATDLLIPVLNLKLSITSYLIGLAIFIPISGWVADRYGTKNVLLLSISLFTICSLLCAIVSTLHEIVIFRFFQGDFV